MGRESEIGESRRWLKQSRDDLEAAGLLTGHSKFAQACFLCQQAGEKAVKALWFFRGGDPWGHSILRLIEDLEDQIIRSKLEEQREEAMLLDRLYIPTRYPNGLPEIAPMEAYGRNDAEAALRAAKALIHVAETFIAT